MSISPMNVDIATLGWLALTLIGGPSPIREHGIGKHVCLISVKTDAATVFVVQQDSTGRILPFGTWHYGQTLCGHWAFRAKQGRLGYVTANDTTWGAPL